MTQKGVVYCVDIVDPDFAGFPVVGLTGDFVHVEDEVFAGGSRGPQKFDLLTDTTIRAEVYRILPIMEEDRLLAFHGGVLFDAGIDERCAELVSGALSDARGLGQGEQPVVVSDGVVRRDVVGEQGVAGVRWCGTVGVQG